MAWMIVIDNMNKANLISTWHEGTIFLSIFESGALVCLFTVNKIAHKLPSIASITYERYDTIILAFKKPLKRLIFDFIRRVCFWLSMFLICC